MITISIITLCVIGSIYCLFRKVGGCGYEVTHRPKSLGTARGREKALQLGRTLHLTSRDPLNFSPDWCSLCGVGYRCILTGPDKEATCFVPPSKSRESLCDSCEVEHVCYISSRKDGISKRQVDYCPYYGKKKEEK